MSSLALKWCGIPQTCSSSLPLCAVEADPLFIHETEKIHKRQPWNKEREMMTGRRMKAYRGIRKASEEKEKSRGEQPVKASKKLRP